MSVTLPPELLDKVYQHMLEDSNEASVQSIIWPCLFVCRSFYYFFCQCLYRNICVIVGHHTRRRLASLSSSLRRYPHISPIIQSLAIQIVNPDYLADNAPKMLRTTGRRKGSSYFNSAGGHIVQVVSDVLDRRRADTFSDIINIIAEQGRLRSFSFLVAGEEDAEIWSTLSEETHDCFRKVCRMSSLKRMRVVRGCGVNPEDLLSPADFLKLTSLDLSTPSSGLPLNRRRFRHQQPIHQSKWTSPSLRSFSISLSDPCSNSHTHHTSRHILDAFPSSYLSSLQKIEIFGISNTSHEVVSLISLIIKSASPSLRHLRLHCQHDSLFIELSAKLSHIFHLAKISILELSCTSKQPREASQTPMCIARFLDALQTPSTLKKLLLDIDPLYHKCRPFSWERGWTALDQVLASVKYSKLEKVDLVVGVLFLDPTPERAVLAPYEHKARQLLPSVGSKQVTLVPRIIRAVYRK